MFEKPDYIYLKIRVCWWGAHFADFTYLRDSMTTSRDKMPSGINNAPHQRRNIYQLGLRRIGMGFFEWLCIQ